MMLTLKTVMDDLALATLKMVMSALVVQLPKETHALKCVVMALTSTQMNVRMATS